MDPQEPTAQTDEGHASLRLLGGDPGPLPDRSPGFLSRGHVTWVRLSRNDVDGVQDTTGRAPWPAQTVTKRHCVVATSPRDAIIGAADPRPSGRPAR